MNVTKCQSVRIYALIDRIRAGEYPNSVTFGKEWGVSSKTILRDVEYLKVLREAPIAYDPIRHGYYFTEDNWDLPAIILSEGEILALLVSANAAHIFGDAPIADKLSGISRRLIEALPRRMTVQREDLFTGMTFTTAALKTIHTEVWSAFVRGLIDQRVVLAHLQPGAQDTRAGDYRFQPLHMANMRGDWFLFARVDQGKAIEQLSLSRFSSAECTDTPFERKCRIDFEKAVQKAFRKAVFFDKRPALFFRLRFCPVLAQVIQSRTYAPDQTVTPNPDGTVDLTFESQSLVEVLWFVLEWGHGVTVMEPPELIELVMEEIERMNHLYAERPALSNEQQETLATYYKETEAKL